MKVFVNGCFDIVHIGHIKLFEFARSLGDELLVAVDSDQRVTLSKGSSRPINTLSDRKEFLNAIRFIDKVLDFSTTNELEMLIKNYQPDFLVVGSDWRNREVVGACYAKEVKYFDRFEGHSTTKIIENIIDR